MQKRMMIITFRSQQLVGNCEQTERFESILNINLPLGHSNSDSCDLTIVTWRLMNAKQTVKQ